MNFKKIFSTIYVNNGKKAFEDGNLLLSLVRQMDPTMPVNQYILLESLVRENGNELLMDARYDSPEDKSEIIEEICAQTEADFYIPRDRMRELCLTFLSIFQHGQDAEQLSQEDYDAQFAPTVQMDFSELQDRAPIMDETMELPVSHPKAAAKAPAAPKEQPAPKMPEPTRKKAEPARAEQKVQPEPEPIVLSLEDSMGSTNIYPEKELLNTHQYEPKATEPEAEVLEEEEETELKKTHRSLNVLIIVLVVVLLVMIGVLVYFLHTLGIF